MDFTLTVEDEAFRDEVRTFLNEEWDPKGFDAYSMTTRSFDFDSAEARDMADEFAQKLIKKG